MEAALATDPFAGRGTTLTPRWSVLPLLFLTLSLLLPSAALAAPAAHAPREVAAQGVVWAWGTNPTGELSDATPTDSSLPVQVTGLTGLVAISGDGHHNLALRADGTVWAWGANASGQLGNGVTNTVPNPFPSRVEGLDGVIAVAAGVGHSLALKGDGTVWAWGDNSAGQLGTGADTRLSTGPAPVVDLADVVAISGGDHHSIALKRDGTVWAWGDNAYSQLGDGTTQDSSHPVQVHDLADVTAIAGGIFHNLALKKDGTVWAWGANYYGQLGDGSTSNSSTPVQVLDLADVTAVAAGVAHSLALKKDGTVWAWGWNDAGQLSIESSTRIRPTPVQVSGLTEVVGIAGGLAHSLAVRADGSVWAWGDNSAGQLGNGTSWQSGRPVQVLGLSGVAQISAGDGHSLALQQTSMVEPAPTAQQAIGGHGAVALSWTDQSDDESGFNLYRDSALIATVDPNITSFIDAGVDCDALHTYKVTAVGSAGESAPSAFRSIRPACAVPGASGVAWSWGSDAFGQLGDASASWANASTCIAVRGLRDMSSVAAGGFHSLAVAADGSVWAWGRNQWGQLGNGTTEDSTSPVQVSNLTGVVSVSAGALYSLAVRSDGTVWAWGDNFSGQLGNGSGEDSTVPVQVGALSEVVAVAAGGSHSLALKRDGTVWAWGRNHLGQLGNGTTWDSDTPVQVSDLTDVTSVAAGVAHSLALKQDGSVWAWGDNSSGQLGVAGSRNFASYSTTPLQVPDVGGVVQVGAGVAYSLALRDDGTVWSWGRYRYGDRELQIAGRSADNPVAPAALPGLTDVTAISAGGVHGLALKQDGSVWAWGWNNAGQLGDGTTWDSAVPVQSNALAGVNALAAGLFHSLAVESTSAA